MIDLQTLIADAKDLEPLPQSTTRLAGLLAGEDWAMPDISRVIRLDEALTGRLLGAANSALSGAREEITSVEAAIMRLGAGSVLALALASSVRKSFQSDLPAYGLDEGALWRHSVATALAVELARPYCRRSIPPQAFAAGLLHDVGKLVLARHLTPAVLAVMHRVQNDDGFVGFEAESAVLEVHHAELGAVVAENWGLPESIAVGIRFHHSPLEAPSDTGRLLCNLVGMADAVASRAGAPGGGPDPDEEFTPAHAERLGITCEGFDGLCEAVEQRLEDVLAWYE